LQYGYQYNIYLYSPLRLQEKTNKQRQTDSLYYAKLASTVTTEANGCNVADKFSKEPQQ